MFYTAQADFSRKNSYMEILKKCESSPGFHTPRVCFFPKKCENSPRCHTALVGFSWAKLWQRDPQKMREFPMFYTARRIFLGKTLT